MSASVTTTNALARLEAWAPIAALKANVYAYPVFEVIHLVGIGTVFGTILIVDLRLIGLMRQLDANTLAKAVIPWTLIGFLLAIVTGLTMFTMRISEMIANPMFIAKICLLFAAGTNAAVLHARGAIDTASVATKSQAILSILIWIAVIFCGRWIAYV
jgi:uncharacterized membrane protein